MIEKVFIIGMMGVGKSSVGFKLSNECEIKFIDIDDRLNLKSITDNNSDYEFRQQEYEEILKCSKLNEKLIISTGGGCVVNVNSRRIIKNFFCIYLHASPDEIIKRINDKSKFRPLIQSAPNGPVNYDLFKSIYDDRINYYQELSNLTVNTDDLNLDNTVKFIKNELVQNEFIN